MIERRGPSILNSKAEFSRCRMPRLKIDMEDWQNKAKKDVQVVSGPRSGQEVSTNNETPAPAETNVEQEEERNMMEDEVRRQEGKRKTAPGGRKPKRRKLEKLVG